MATRISVVLSTVDTGFELEAEWDSWVAYVDEHLDELVGEPVEVDGISWRARRDAPHCDVIHVNDGVSMEEWDALMGRVKGGIAACWEGWCAEGVVEAEGLDKLAEFVVSVAPELDGSVNPRPTSTGVPRGWDVAVLVRMGAGGEIVAGEVTLVPREDGGPGYVAYGPGPDYWVSGELLRLLGVHLGHGDALRCMLDRIESVAAGAMRKG
jgi:hypothetical protein